MDALVIPTQLGLYCPAGDFYIDPWRPVENALITHAHSDHARTGSENYWASESCLPLLRHRLGQEIQVQGVPYGQPISFKNTIVSFHSAGHILGSSQIRIEAKGQVWVISGDFKRGFDPTCPEFEVVPCDTFITEATFSLPIYRWDPSSVTAAEILAWWERNRALGRTSLLFCYALGKAQRVLGELAKLTDPDRVVYTHGAVEPLTELYRQAGVKMLPTVPVVHAEKKTHLAGELVLAPPSAYRSVWMKRFKEFETGFASGWMRVRAARRRSGYDRGFILSDHADWPQLLQTVEDTGASQILATHGNTDVLVRALQQKGLKASALSTLYGHSEDDEVVAV